jgi:hypothetical protein
MASIAAMPNKIRPILLALMLAAVAAGLLGCGGDSGPAPSIPSESSQTLLSKIAEIKANVDVGSCFVAADKTDDLLADIDALPSGVDQQVQNALVRGANNLKGLLTDPSKCQGRAATTTTAPPTTESTTPETTTQETQPTTTSQPPTTTQTQTQPSTTPGGNGGNGGNSGNGGNGGNGSGGLGPGGL